MDDQNGNANINGNGGNMPEQPAPNNMYQGYSAPNQPPLAPYQNQVPPINPTGTENPYTAANPTLAPMQVTTGENESFITKLKEQYLWVLLVATSVLTIIGVISLILIKDNLINSSKKQPIQSQQVKKTEVKSLSPASITTNLRSALSKKYKLIEFEDQQGIGVLSGDQIGVKEDASTPPYKATSYDFYTKYSDNSSNLHLIAAPSLNANNKRLPDNVLTIITSTYESLGLTLEAPEKEAQGFIYYSGKGLFCRISVTTDQADGSSAGCGEIIKYNESYNAILPFLDVAKAPKNASAIYGNLDIKDSETKGFKFALINKVNRPDNAATNMIFYQKDTDPTWTYFKSALNNGLPCTDYNTPELQQIFAGESCIDPKNPRAVVKILD